MVHFKGDHIDIFFYSACNRLLRSCKIAQKEEFCTAAILTISPIAVKIPKVAATVTAAVYSNIFFCFFVFFSVKECWAGVADGGQPQILACSSGIAQNSSYVRNV